MQMVKAALMSVALVAAIRESGGYLEDEGWQQTAQLMSLAADEIHRPLAFLATPVRLVDLVVLRC